MTLLKQNIISNNRYIVRFAQGISDVQAAQRLRFNVFNAELGEGLDDSHYQQLDSDKYDAQCHHLLVIHREDERVIGTYRMQPYDMACSKAGLYSAEEFNLCTIPRHILKQSVEVGRACIEKEHRNGRVLYLLWRGIAQYLNYMKARYLLGCCSITSQSEQEGWLVMKYLREHELLHNQIMVSIMPAYQCRSMQEAVHSQRKTEGLPQLFRLYMDLGARVCSPPAIDRAFKTIDYLVILDVENLDERTKILFFN